MMSCPQFLGDIPVIKEKRAFEGLFHILVFNKITIINPL